MRLASLLLPLAVLALGFGLPGHGHHHHHQLQVSCVIPQPGHWTPNICLASG